MRPLATGRVRVAAATGQGGGGRAECDGRSAVVVCAVLSASQGFPLRTAVYSQLFRWGQRTLQLAFRLGTADATVWPGWLIVLAESLFSG